jgi:hypothetical protein
MILVQTGPLPVVCELDLEFQLFPSNGPVAHGASRPPAGAAPCSVGMLTRQLTVSNRGTGHFTENRLRKHLASLPSEHPKRKSQMPRG